jgi:hypothetical protein
VFCRENDVGKITGKCQKRGQSESPVRPARRDLHFPSLRLSLTPLFFTQKRRINKQKKAEQGGERGGFTNLLGILFPPPLRAILSLYSVLAEMLLRKTGQAGSHATLTLTELSAVHTNTTHTTLFVPRVPRALVHTQLTGSPTPSLSLSLSDDVRARGGCTRGSCTTTPPSSLPLAAAVSVVMFLLP